MKNEESERKQYILTHNQGVLGSSPRGRAIKESYVKHSSFLLLLTDKKLCYLHN